MIGTSLGPYNILETLGAGGMGEVSVFGGEPYDVADDGRFLLLRDPEREEESLTITVVVNWFEELKQLVPLR